MNYKLYHIINILKQESIRTRSTSVAFNAFEYLLNNEGPTWHPEYRKNLIKKNNYF